MRGPDCKTCTPVHSEEPVTDREECHSCRHVLSTSNISSLEREESLRRELGTGVVRISNQVEGEPVTVLLIGRYNWLRPDDMEELNQTSHTLVNILQVNPRVEGSGSGPRNHTRR